MTTVNCLKGAVIAAALSVTAALPAQATQEDRVDCYAQVHESCYPGGGANQCPPGDYEAALDICDTYASEGEGDDSAVRRPPAPANLKATMSKSDPQFIMKLKQELKRKYGKR